MKHLERDIQQLFKYEDFEFQKQFDWLKHKGKLFIDFYFPKHNIAIECQGEQHFIPIDFAGKGKEWAEKQFSENIKRDESKKEKCEKNKIEVLYVNKNNFENVINKWLDVNSLA